MSPATVAERAPEVPWPKGVRHMRHARVLSPVVKTVLRTGRCNDTSPPVGCCGGTSVPGEEPMRGV
jgi:hypothetical protein